MRQTAPMKAFFKITNPNKQKISSTAKIPHKFNQISITEKVRRIVDDRVSCEMASKSDGAQLVISLKKRGLFIQNVFKICW
jgi:hypothetical protein